MSRCQSGQRKGGHRDTDEGQRRKRRHQAGREFRRPKHEHRKTLQLVKEDRFVEERLFVEIRHPPVAAGHHLAGGLSVVGLIGIPECRDAEAPEQDDKNHRGGQDNQRAFFGNPAGAAVLLRLYSGVDTLIIGCSDKGQF